LNENNNKSGGDSEEDTPVPIPNTEVKLFSADGSWGATPCESRTLPGLSFHSSSVVERSAVNRVVAGSNPACGAIPFGELSEWSKEHDWKSCRRSTPSQGFESLALRHDRFVIMARWSSG
jgi:hypothetical protein